MIRAWRFANELSIICDRLEIKVGGLIRLAKLHPRLTVLQLGIGLGGHCIAMDPWSIDNSTLEEACIIRIAGQANDNKRVCVARKIKAPAASVYWPFRLRPKG